MRSHFCRTAGWMLMAGAVGFVVPNAFGQAAAPAPAAPAPAVATPTPAAAPAAAEPVSEFDQFAKDVKQPVDWFKWGFDLRNRDEYAPNATTTSGNLANHERHYTRHRARLWGSFIPDKNLELNFRLAWEGRYWFHPNAMEGWYDGPLLVDQLNVKWKEIFGLPLTAQIGRQDMKLGDGWLVMEGTPLDGSRTFFFDAARFTWDWKDAQTTIDAIFINQGGQDDKYIDTIGGVEEEDLIEQDERGAILYVRNKSIKDVTVDGYFIYKHNDPINKTFRSGTGGVFRSVSDDGEMYTFGGRVEHQLTTNWKYRLEGAGQFGDNRDRDLLAFGTTNRLTYEFKDAWNTEAHGGFEFLSGDDRGTPNDDEQFYPLWGRYPAWSELLIYTTAPETRVSEITNLYRANVGVSTRPVKNLELLFDYHAIFADQNMTGAGYDSQDNFRGHLLGSWVKYKFNQYLSAHVVGEVFFPGDYYDHPRLDVSAFVRAEVVFTF